METKFIDLHVHPAMKPLGKSFNSNPGVNHPNKNRKASIWHADPPSLLDKIADILLTLTKFRQSDFTSLARGGAHVVCVSLCGLEKEFVMNKLGESFPADVLNNLVVGLGRKRINHIQDMDKYFPDLLLEYNFYKQLDGYEKRINNQRYRYKIISQFDEIEHEENTQVKTIYVILTIEGTNVFNSGLKMMGKSVNETEILTNIDKVKNWDKRLFFIGMAHHFNNEMVGHAQSLHGIVKAMCDQKEGQDKGFTELGWKVLRKLLDNSEGKRILIDLKHMSVKSRQEYYNFLDKEYPDENIPLIASHGAVNGFRSFKEHLEDDEHNLGKYLPYDINFFDNELIRIAKSGGLFGVQFDERRVASKDELKKSGGRLNRRRMLFHKSKLIWNQIQHIATLLNRNNMYAWGIQCIGSDYDGIVNSLNGYWTAEEMPLFDSYLEKHAYNFLASNQSDSLTQQNLTTANEIVERFMHTNAYEFLERNF